MSKTNTGKKKYIVLKVVLAVFVIAFFASILYTPVYDSLAPEHIKNFNQEQALEDYDYMWEVLEANFPHFNVASRKYGTNYIEVKNRYRKYIEENKNIDFITFNNLIYRCLYEFRGVGHLAPLSYPLYSMLYTTSVEVNNDASISESYGDFFKYAFEIFNNERSVLTYKYLSGRTLKDVWLTKTFLSGDSKATTNGPSKNLEFKTLASGVPYVCIYNFFQENVEKDREALLAFFEANADKDAIVIDMTRNGGGSDFYWAQNLVSPNIEERAVVDKYYVLFKNTEHTKKIFDLFGLDVGTDIFYKADYPNIAAFSKVDEADIAPLELFLERPQFNPEPLSAQKIFKGKIYVLTNQSVGSAGEGFAAYCKQTGFATLVGSETQGNAPGLNPVYFTMPNSGLMFTFQIDYKIDADGVCDTEFGTQPDILSLPGETPMDTLLRVLEG